MFCGECGAALNATEEFCGSCGARAHEERPASVMPPQRSGLGVLPMTRTILHSLTEGPVIRKSVAVALQLVALLVLLGGVYLLVELLKLAFQLPSTQATIGGLLLAIFVVAAMLAVAQILLYRAQSVRELPDSQFTVVPIISILFRSAGETHALVALAAGIGGCLFIWFSGMNPRSMLSQLGPFLPSLPSGGQTFVDGLVFLAALALTAFGVLVISYGLAELVVVAVDIAINVRLLVKIQRGPRDDMP